jgi:hypothetical protein
VNVPFQIKVPADVALALNARCTELRVAVELELQSIDRKLRLGKNTEKLTADRKKLAEQARALSLGNLLRAAINEGQSILKLKNETLLTKLAEGGLTRGRRRNGA